MKYIKILLYLPLVLLLACEPPVIEEAVIIDNETLPPAILDTDSKPPVVGDNPPVVGDNPPVVGDNPPVVGDNPPTIDNSLPIRIGKWPPFGNRPPVIDNSLPPFVNNDLPPYIDNSLPPFVGNDLPPYIDQAPPADQPIIDNSSPEWIDGITVPETKYPINKKALRELRIGDILYVDMFRHNDNAATFDLTPLGLRKNIDNGFDFVSIGYFSDNKTDIANNTFVIRRNPLVPDPATVGPYSWDVYPANFGPNNSHGRIDVISTKDSETGSWKQTIYTGMPVDYTINDTDDDENNNFIKVSSRDIKRVSIQILYRKGLEVLTLKGLNDGSGRVEVVGMFTSRGSNNDGEYIGDNDFYGPYIDSKVSHNKKLRLVPTF